MSIQIDISTWVKNKNYPEWMDEIAVSMISKGYLLPDEDVFDAFKRVSKSAARRLKRKDLQPYFYEAIVKNWLCLASPVLSNMGTERGMPISCFGIDVGDSIEGIADANSELMRLSSQGGGVGIGVSRIRGRGKPIRDNGVSEGVVPWNSSPTTIGCPALSRSRNTTALILLLNVSQRSLNVRTSVLNWNSLSSLYSMSANTTLPA